jgi:hypothetical protein
MRLGQTSVEWHVNRVQRRKAKQEGRPFVNPHDFGFQRNWEHFLGKHSLMFVLLPSLVAPPPLGAFRFLLSPSHSEVGGMTPARRVSLTDGTRLPDESVESHYAGV